MPRFVQQVLTAARLPVQQTLQPQTLSSGSSPWFPAAVTSPAYAAAVVTAPTSSTYFGTSKSLGGMPYGYGYYGSPYDPLYVSLGQSAYNPVLGMGTYPSFGTSPVPATTIDVPSSLLRQPQNLTYPQYDPRYGYYNPAYLGVSSPSSTYGLYGYPGTVPSSSYFAYGYPYPYGYPYAGAPYSSGGNQYSTPSYYPAGYPLQLTQPFTATPSQNPEYSPVYGVPGTPTSGSVYLGISKSLEGSRYGYPYYGVPYYASPYAPIYTSPRQSTYNPVLGIGTYPSLSNTSPYPYASPYYGSGSYSYQLCSYLSSGCSSVYGQFRFGYAPSTYSTNLCGYSSYDLGCYNANAPQYITCYDPRTALSQPACLKYLPPVAQQVANMAATPFSYLPPAPGVPFMYAQPAYGQPYAGSLGYASAYPGGPAYPAGSPPGYGAPPLPYEPSTSEQYMGPAAYPPPPYIPAGPVPQASIPTGGTQPFVATQPSVPQMAPMPQAVVSPPAQQPSSVAPPAFPSSGMTQPAVPQPFIPPAFAQPSGAQVSNPIAAAPFAPAANVGDVAASGLQPDGTVRPLPAAVAAAPFAALPSAGVLPKTGAAMGLGANGFGASAAALLAVLTGLAMWGWTFVMRRRHR